MRMAFDAGLERSDEALLALYALGDPAAARDLAARLLPRTLGYAARLLNGDRAEAEDVAQEAMLRLWKIAPDWRAGEAKVTTWLYRVVTNLCSDRRRGAGRRAVPMGDDLPDALDEAPGSEAQMLQAARVSALDGALADLPDRQREAVILRHIEGLTNPEIALVMGIGVEAVESLTARGKRALTAALGQKREALGYYED
ncbi:RNA polymerase sigma factor [Xinfangfangia sp. CPCC 101601]|uniref:RNA polymerase sigma factor n=1 Tax=Pseudogemmobacter lacusdianii TaxID=3069608 RepID=A0ABU0VVB1_9RHOB|nr:RNA polymerase sigma factor [Xinfangfangia sp. CPCC 101601]MDQ2065667.1 RNA polymerase sigma factor [Xinfangfangia sp. CPCC 101601]